MAKKMKSPEKSLPTEMAASSGSGSAPDIQVPESSSSATSSEGAFPTQTPPSVSSSESSTAFGAAVWATDKRVTAMYNTHDARNAWMHIGGTGWVRLTNASDSACEAMNILACHARTKSCRIDYAVDAGLTTEIYIW